MIYIASDNQEQKKMRVFLRVYPIVFFLIAFICGEVEAQDLNPTIIEAKILQGESFAFDFISNKPISIVSQENVAEGSASTEEVTVNLDYRFVYDSDPDFVGESHFVIERSSIIGSNKVYTEVKIKVVPSLLEAMKDVAFIPFGTTDVTIDVLANDISGNGLSTVSSLELISNGSASIQDNKITFSKASGFEGMTSFNYTIEDASGYKSSGVVVINAQGATPLAGSRLDYLTSNYASVDIIIDDQSYNLDGSSILNMGSLNRSGNYVFTYTPLLTSVGQETFFLQNDQGGQIEVGINIIDDGTSTSLVRDDVFYTPIGAILTFDPRENDFSQDGVLLDYSDELSFDGSVFTYTPEPGFSGVKEFYYTILDGLKEVAGQIEIYIGDYLPQLDSYAFETYENTPFVIEYGSPLEDYQWNLISSPRNGEMSMNVGSYASPACSIISGKSMVIYIPDNGFIGNDVFKIEYCVGNGACKQVDVSVDVIAATESCHCFGDDCVWAGDADNDGKVSVKDILSIGYNYGETGSSRTAISNEWGANHAVDWPFEQDEGSVNNKFADGNGDGVINASDASVLNANINAYHNINAEEVIALKDLPISYVYRNGSPQIGLNIIDIYVGSSAIPAEDLRGVVFSLQFPTDAVDPESIKFTPSDEWIGTGSPILSAVDVNNGLLSVGLARTANEGIYGSGRIGETRLIIRVDTDGTRPGEDKYPIDISFKSARMSNNKGKSFKIEGQSQLIEIELDQLKDSAEPSVIIFPNPSSDRLSFHANNRDELIDIQIYNMMGGLLSEHLNINDVALDIQHTLPQGIYTAAIKTKKGYTVKKIQVINIR